jgi:uncharacterized protein YeaC (DUF1315 family)
MGSLIIYCLFAHSFHHKDFSFFQSSTVILICSVLILILNCPLFQDVTNVVKMGTWPGTVPVAAEPDVVEVQAVALEVALAAVRDMEREEVGMHCCCSVCLSSINQLFQYQGRLEVAVFNFSPNIFGCTAR